MGVNNQDGNILAALSDFTVHLATRDGNERRAISELLTEQGARVIVYTTADALWRALSVTPPETRSACILAEDRNGRSLSGIALTERVRAAKLPIPVLLIGCEPTISRAVQAIRAGAAEYLARPLLAHQLLRSIAEYRG